MHYVNKNKIIEAFVVKPYQPNPYDAFASQTPHGWQVSLIFGYFENGVPMNSVIDKQSEHECHQLLLDLGLSNINP